MTSDSVSDIPILTRKLAEAFSSWDVFVLIVGMFVGLAIVLYWIVPYFSKTVEEDWNQVRVAGTLVGVVGAFYGILFGFVNVTLWQNFQLTQNILNKEATALSAIVTNDAVFSPSMQASLNGTIKAYILEVSNNEWRLMRTGQASQRAQALSLQLLTLLQSYVPRSSIEAPYYSVVLSQINQVMSLRRERIEAVNNKIPNPVFRVLSIGSVLLVILLSIVTFRTSRGPFLLYINIVVNILIAFNLCLVLDLDNTFSGQVKLNNSAYFSGELKNL